MILKHKFVSHTVVSCDGMDWIVSFRNTVQYEVDNEPVSSVKAGNTLISSEIIPY